MTQTSEQALSPYPSILIIGDSGAHKTWFEGTCPKPYIFNFDKSTAILRSVPNVEYDNFKDVSLGVKLTDLLKKNGVYESGTAWPAFIKKLNQIGDRMEKEEEIPFRTLCFDSLTTMSMAAMSYVFREAGYAGNPQVQHYQSQMELIKRVFDQLAAWPVIKVATAHIQRDTNDITGGGLEYLPLVTGKLAASLPSFFDEVYFAEVDKEGKFVLKTKKSTIYKQAKSTYGVPDGTETSWQAIEPYILGTATTAKKEKP
jgi:hypothetical protein